MRCFALAVVFLALSACEDRETCEVTAQIDSVVRIGAGERSFEAVDDGDTLEVEYGSQGGAHVWIALQTEGVAPGKNPIGREEEPAPIGTFTLFADGLEAGWGEPDGQFKGNGERAEAVGQMLFVDPWDEAATNADAYTIVVEIEDACGTVVADEVTVNLNW